jgi:hypothetical protein
MEFRRALVQILLEDASDLIEMLDLGEMMRDLQARLDDPDQYSAFGKLTREILREANIDSPMKLDAYDFNQAAERYYRNRLRIKHIQEAFRLVEEDFRQIASGREDLTAIERESLRFILQDQSLPNFLSAMGAQVIEGGISADRLRRIINLLLVSVHHDIKQAETITKGAEGFEDAAPSVYRAGYR